MGLKSSLLVIILVISVFPFFLLTQVAAAPLSGTTTPISVGTPSANHGESAVYDTTIVWRDDRSGFNNIYLYDSSTGLERILSSGTANKANPAISGHYVVWQDDQFFAEGNGTDIVLYDLNTDTSTRIANCTGDQTNPSIDGDLVVWQDTRNGLNADIYLYSISAGTELRVSSGTGDQVNPRVSGNRIAWENTSFYPSQIALYDYAGNRTPFQPITLDAGEDQKNPAISNNLLVWSDNHQDLTYYRVYLEDLSTGEIQVITPDDNDHTSPDIDGTRVIWRESDDVFLNDTAVPESETMVTSTFGATTKENLRIDGNRIVWRESDGASDMVYLHTIGMSETCPVADFSIAPSQTGPVPFAVSFSDSSSNPPGNPVAHWTWDFGDGNSSHVQNPSWTFVRSGSYDVRLSVDNSLCRSMTPVDPAYRITAGVAPVAGITASNVSGMVPLIVTFTDTSASATSWNWSFGDGTYEEMNPVTHTYTRGGTFTVSLEAANAWGHSHAQKTIQALTGANMNAYTTIPGISVSNRFGGQFLVYNGTMHPGYLQPAASLLISPALPDYGWQNITFRSGDGIGFHDYGNSTLMGNLTGVFFQSSEIIPAGFSVPTGSQSSVNYSLDLSSYPIGGTLNAQVWEGVLAPDLAKIQLIAHGSGWSHVLGTAYTLKATKTHFNPGSPATIHFSVNSSWVAANQGRNHTFLVRIGDDGLGEVLPSQFLYRDAEKNLDFFSSYSPRGMSTFGVSQLAGSGNPFQLITLSVVSHSPDPPVNPGDVPTDPDTSPGTVSGKGAAPQHALQDKSVEKTAQVDPGRTEKVYTNTLGVVTQATTVTSTDSFASLNLPAGVMAKDRDGNPLSTISIAAGSPGTVESTLKGSGFMFDGLVYELGPDGAVFTPSVSLTFTIPQAQWGREYAIRTFDPVSGTWQDLPVTYDPSAGTITARVTHFCCFALFSRTTGNSPPTVTPVRTPVVAPPPAASPPTTAISIFTSMMTWVTHLLLNNWLIIVIGILVIIGALIIRRSRLNGSDI
jgi:beta propeller repeat protein